MRIMIGGSFPLFRRDDKGIKRGYNGCGEPFSQSRGKTTTPFNPTDLYRDIYVCLYGILYVSLYC